MEIAGTVGAQTSKILVMASTKKKIKNTNTVRVQAPKLASLQAFEPTNAGLKPTSQGFKPQAIIYQFQDPVPRVQANKLGVRGPGNKDK